MASLAPQPLEPHSLVLQSLGCKSEKITLGPTETTHPPEVYYSIASTLSKDYIFCISVYLITVEDKVNLSTILISFQCFKVVNLSTILILLKHVSKLSFNEPDVDLQEPHRVYKVWQSKK